MVCKCCLANAVRVTDVVHRRIQCAPSREYLRRWGKRVADPVVGSYPWTARRLVCDKCGMQFRTIEVPVDYVPRRWTRKVPEGEEEE